MCRGKSVGRYAPAAAHRPTFRRVHAPAWRRTLTDRTAVGGEYDVASAKKPKVAPFAMPATALGYNG